MAAIVAVCSCLGKKRLTHFITAIVCLPNPRTHVVLWRSCSQYKQIASNGDLLLSQFISPFTGCIRERHITGLCWKQQKEVTKAVKRAQIIDFMPVTYKDPVYLKGLQV
ncbi:28S ribosomal protein S18c, mitochondrial-like isoform X1 [Pteropus medius]|uniref:28S ribosomal protein S18c, mitochondrial-like isoform X1 n=1 Tax=Pteropus vampyrus TaxID=132908 RepID=UPI00196AB4BE|nr:28S ribosomal protein S18c, mitochondrial-like isoform X1 [Pteropus giganteus]